MTPATLPPIRRCLNCESRLVTEEEEYCVICKPDIENYDDLVSQGRSAVQRALAKVDRHGCIIAAPPEELSERESRIYEGLNILRAANDEYLMEWRMRHGKPFVEAVIEMLEGEAVPTRGPTSVTRGSGTGNGWRNRTVCPTGGGLDG